MLGVSPQFEDTHHTKSAAERADPRASRAAITALQPRRRLAETPERCSRCKNIQFSKQPEYLSTRGRRFGQRQLVTMRVGLPPPPPGARVSSIAP